MTKHPTRQTVLQPGKKTSADPNEIGMGEVSMTFLKAALVPAILGLLAGVSAAAPPSVDPAVDWARRQDPPLEMPPLLVEWPDSLRLLWQRALGHSEADLQREAADSITRAHQLGMPNLEELKPALMKVLDQPDQHPVARVAAARALVETGAKDSASLLAKHAQQGPIELALVVEPALARWDHAPMRDVWLERLQQPDVRAARLELAIDGLATVGEMRAVADLTRLASGSREHPTTRLAAARALGRIQRSGLEDLARRLAGRANRAGLLDRLVAANLLAHHSSDATLTILDRLAEDEEPAVAGQAMQRLLEIAPQRLIARASSSLLDRDSRIRHLAVKALATEPSAASIARLAPLLDDRVPEIREDVRRTLLTMAAAAELQPEVVRHTTQVLGTDGWRGFEQAILILTELDQQQVGARYLELLHHDHPRVYVTAAWGLRNLAVAELAGPMFTEAQELSTQKGDLSQERSEELAHLLEAMGRMKHQAAESHLREYVPKQAPYREDVRAAAIWSLGQLLSDRADEPLAAQLRERVADVASVPAELPEVRTMSAVTLGRMKSESSLDFLRDWFRRDGAYSYTGLACAWAASQISDEPMPEFQIVSKQVTGWFLEPAERR